MRRIGWVFVLFVMGMKMPGACATIHTEAVEYHDGETLLEGYLAYDQDIEGQRPSVLIVHEWMGLGAYAKHRAEQLAQLGYVAFAADMYGKGVYAKDHNEAAALSGAYRNDRQLMRRRISAALATLKQQPMIDPTRVAAIGYCFGGMTVLELARSGADVLGVVSFHGILDTPTPADAQQIKGRVLAFQGEMDPYVTAKERDAFEQEMRNAHVRYQLVVYPGVVHSFTMPEAGNDPSMGAAYDAQADAASWEQMTRFLRELFQGSAMQDIG